MKRSQSTASSQWLPITDNMLLVTFKSLDLLIPDHGMFWAACNLTYFGFLRLVELTVPNLASFSNAFHLNVEDIAVNSDNNPSCLWLKSKASKTDPFHKGFFIHIHATIPSVLSNWSWPTCQLGAALDGHHLSRTVLTNWIRQILGPLAKQYLQYHLNI